MMRVKALIQDTICLSDLFFQNDARYITFSNSDILFVGDIIALLNLETQPFLPADHYREKLPNLYFREIQLKGFNKKMFIYSENKEDLFRYKNENPKVCRYQETNYKNIFCTGMKDKFIVWPSTEEK